MAVKSDVTFDVLASIALGSAGVVNGPEFIKQLQKQTTQMMKGVTIDGGVLKVDPDFKLDPKAMRGLKAHMEREIGALEQAIGQRRGGQRTLDAGLLESLYGDSKKAQRKAQLAAANINKLTDQQLGQLKRFRQESLDFLESRDRLQRLSARDIKTLTDPKLMQQYPKQFKEARVAVEGFQRSIANMNKALSGQNFEKIFLGENIPTQIRGLKAASAEMRNLEAGLKETLRKSDLVQKQLGTPETAAQMARRQAQEQKKAQLALGRQLYGQYGINVRDADIEPVLTARKVERQRLVQGRAAGALSPAELKDYERAHRQVTGEVETLSSALKEYKKREDVIRAAKARDAQRQKEEVRQEQQRRKAATLRAADEARRTDLSKITDEAQLGRLRQDVKAGERVVQEGLKDTRAIKDRTREQESLLRSYQSLRRELSNTSKAIDSRVNDIRKERREMEKLRADLAREAEARRKSGRLARQALTAGVTDVGQDFDKGSVFERRKKDLDDYVKRLDNVIKAERAAVSPDQKKIDRLQRIQDRYRDASRALDGYRRGVVEQNAAQGRAYQQGQRFIQTLDKTSKSAGNLRDRLGETGLLLRQFFRYALGYGALYQVIAAVTALTRSVIELEKELKSIQAISAATDEQMISVGAAIKAVATQTKFTTSEVARSARVLAQAGVGPEEINNVLKSVSLFAAGTETAIETAADVVSTMRNVFKELDDIQIADKLTKAINISKLTGEDLKVILSISAQIGRSFELSSDQYLAAVSTLRNAGLKASTVATGLRQGLLEIFNPDTKSLGALANRYAQIGEAMNKQDIIERFQSFRQQANPLVAALQELDRLGFTGEGRRTFARAFDIRAENAISALINNLDKLQEAEARISLGGAAAEAADKQLESLANSVSNLGAAMSVLAADVLDGPVAALEDMVDAATKSILALDDLDLKLKSLGGTGVGVAGGAALVGGIAGAALTPGKALAKVFGAVLGATAGGAAGVGTLGGAETSKDVATIESGISLVENVLLTLSAIQLLKGRFPGLAAGNAKRVVGQAALAIGQLGGFFTSLATFGKGLKLALLGVARFLGPVGIGVSIIGAIWSLYEFFSESEKTADQLERSTKAAKERSIRARQKLEQQIQELQDYQLTDRESGIKAAKGSSADQLERATLSLESSRATLSKEFLGDVEGIEKYAEILNRLSSGPAAQENSTARREALDSLERAVEEDARRAGRDIDLNLNDLEGNRRRFMGELIRSYTGSVKSLTSVAQGLFERYNRLSTKVDKSDLERAFVDQMNEALDSSPIMRRIYNGDTEAILELGGTKQVAEAIRNMYDAIASDAGSISEQIDQELETYAGRMAALMAEISAKLRSGEITQTQAFNMLSGEIDTLSNSATGAASALQVTIQTMASKLDELRGEAEQLDKQLGGRATAAYAAQNKGALADLYRGRREDLQARRDALNSEIKTYEEGIRKAQDTQAGFETIARNINTETQADALALFKNIQENKRFLENDEAFQTQLATRGAEFKALYEAAKSGLESSFVDLYSQLDARQSARLGAGNEVRTATRAGVNLGGAVTNLISRKAVAKREELGRVDQTKFAKDPYTALRVGQLDEQIKYLQRRKSPELFAEGGPIKEKFDLLIREAELELASINKNIATAAASGGEQANFDKLQSLRKQQSDAISKMGKLEGEMAEQMQKARDAFAKQTIETKQRREAAKRGQLQEQLRQAEINGSMEEMANLQDQRLQVELNLLDLERDKMLLEGKDASLVEEIISNREQQLRSAEASRRVSEQIRRLDESLYNVSTAPSTGDPALDKLREISGLDFTNKEKVNSLQGSLAEYSRVLQELYALQAQNKDNDQAFQQYQRRIDAVRVSISELVGQIDHLQTDGAEQIRRAFDPHRLLTDFQALESAIQNLGDNVRETMVSTFDQVGSSLVDAVVKGESAVEALRSLFHNMFLDIAKQTADTLMNQLYQNILQGQNGEGGIFGGLFGGIFGGGTAGASPEIVATNANVAATQANTLALQANTQAKLGGVEGGLGGILGGGTAGTQVDPVTVLDDGLGEVTDAVGKVVTNQGAQTAAQGGFFSQLGSMFMAGLSSLGGMLNSVFSSIGGLFGGGGGGGGSFLTTLIGGLFGAAKNGWANMQFSGGGAGLGQGQGAVSDSGMISGPGTGTSDSIAAALFGSHGVRPIAVSTGESILNQGATRMLGENLINAVNRRGRIRGFASGGVLSEKIKTAVTGQTSSSPNVNVSSPTKVVNILDKSVMHDYATSSENEKVILNVIQRNPRAVRTYLGA